MSDLAPDSETQKTESDGGTQKPVLRSTWLDFVVPLVFFLIFVAIFGNEETSTTIYALWAGVAAFFVSLIIDFLVFRKMRRKTYTVKKSYYFAQAFLFGGACFAAHLVVNLIG